MDINLRILWLHIRDDDAREEELRMLCVRCHQSFSWDSSVKCPIRLCKETGTKGFVCHSCNQHLLSVRQEQKKEKRRLRSAKKQEERKRALEEGNVLSEVKRKKKNVPAIQLDLR